MDKGCRAVLYTVAGACGAMAVGRTALAFESHGYMRSGIGGSQGGSQQVCFRDPGTEGASGKFRLGNECETYIELMFEETYQNGDLKAAVDKDQVYFASVARVALQSRNLHDWEPTDTQRVNPTQAGGDLTTDFSLALREAYVEGFNVLGRGVNAWAGKRFYRRYDVYMLDYYFIETDGPGAGIEDINLGFAKLQLAVMRNVPGPASTDGPPQTDVDVRLTELHVGGGGTLSPIYMYGTSGSAGSVTGRNVWEALDGHQLSLLWTQPRVLGGENLVALQYGQGIFGGDAGGDQSALSEYGGYGSQEIAKGDTGARNARERSHTIRAIEHLIANPVAWLSAEYVLLYQSVDFGGAKRETGVVGATLPVKTEITTGIRPVFHFDEIHDLAVEYGYNHIQGVVGLAGAHETGTPVLQKLTVAPQITAAPSYFGRPQLRIFGTYAKWNDDAKGKVGGTVYAGDTAGWSAGAQVETWW